LDSIGRFFLPKTSGHTEAFPVSSNAQFQKNEKTDHFQKHCGDIFFLNINDAVYQVFSGEVKVANGPKTILYFKIIQQSRISNQIVQKYKLAPLRLIENLKAYVFSSFMFHNCVRCVFRMGDNNTPINLLMPFSVAASKGVVRVDKTIVQLLINKLKRTHQSDK
jgi:hypothetical protein